MPSGSKPHHQYSTGFHYYQIYISFALQVSSCSLLSLAHNFQNQLSQAWEGFTILCSYEQLCNTLGLA